MIIYMEQTLNLLVSAGKKWKVDELIKQGEGKQLENGLRYLKIVKQ